MLTPIWLDRALYPDHQRTYNTIFCDHKGFRFAAAEFRRSYAFARDISSVSLRVSGDTRFYLWVNGKMAVAGPVPEGGDYANTAPMKKHYFTPLTLEVCGRTLDFFARVYLGPDVMTDYSQGHGAFMLDAEVTFADGTSETVSTGPDWSARFDGSWRSTTEFVQTEPDEWRSAAVTENIWNLTPSPLPVLSECYLAPQTGSTLTADAGGTAEFDFTYKNIWAGYLTFSCDGPCDVAMEVYEVDGAHAGEHVRTTGPLDYRSLRIESIGGVRVKLQNLSDRPVALTGFGMIETHYPVTGEGSFECSDAKLSLIYGVAKHTLEICRQNLHLDSPLHQETLGCTGDYNIESLMTDFAFGDNRLARLDVVRTADWLAQSGGFMFHTTYSLIWLQMAWNCYTFTADRSLIDYILPSARILLDRFETYKGSDGLIDDPPSFMFVDWGPVEGYSLHHPPKNLGQTVLCAFYYEALKLMADMLETVGQNGEADRYKALAVRFRTDFQQLYDPARGLYCDGLDGGCQTNQWLPAGNGKRYFSKHANCLAVLYGLCGPDKANDIMEKVINDASLTDVQPYFMFYILEALHKTKLFGRYGLSQLHRFDVLTADTKKGLDEGWGDFHGDHSHAWGGAAVYILPREFLGFEMVRPGFEEIKLSPDLWGLDSADVTMPTPYGYIRCHMAKGEETRLEVPVQIKYTISQGD